MAKLTNKIRINEYDVVNNQFNLTFQLSGYSDQLSFEALVADNSVLYIEGDSDDNLVGLGFSNSDIHQMINELVQWLEKPRKQLNDNSHIYTMRSRFEVAERMEQEHRGKAAVERILVEAPCMDWAMSVTEELVDEAEEKPLIDIRTIIDHPSVVDTLYQITNGARMARSPETDTSAVEELNDALNAARLSVQAISDRIAAMAAAGLGEVLVHPLEQIAAFNKAINGGSPSPTTETAATNAWVPLSARPYSGKSYLYDLVWNTRFHLTRAESLTRRRHPNKASEAFENLDAAFGKLCDYVDYFEKPQALPTAEIDKAINAIHTHARRFTKPMTLREHDFLRAIIQEEIEKVVEVCCKSSAVRTSSCESRNISLP